MKKHVLIVGAIVALLAMVPTSGGASVHASAEKVVTAPSAAPLRIMIVGDSISLGCDDVPVAGWCGELTTLLADRGITVSIAGVVHSGWSCGALVSEYAARFNQLQPNVVILACGTNDVPNNPATAATLGTAWRTMVEYAYTHGALSVPVFVQYSNKEINDNVGRSWLIPGEGMANDTIYANRQLYVSATPLWFAGLIDFQRVPGDWNYLNGGTDGIHPNALGKQVYAKIVYRALRETYGWPDTVSEPCGMWGHRAIYAPGNFTPCTALN